MAYTINLTDGSLLTTVADGTVDTTTCSLTLIGKNYSGYGTFFNDNLVHLLENSSNSTAPSNPLQGQLWWDTAGNLSVWTGSSFKVLGALTSSGSTPTGAVTGNMWWNTADEQLKIYNGTSWILIGPPNTAGTGTSGVLVGNIIDISAVTHVATNVWVNSTLVGIFSADAEYTPQTGISGFSKVKPGLNLASPDMLSGSTVWGTANNASYLGNVIASSYARIDQSTVFSANVTANVGFILGTSSNLIVNLTGINAAITNTINNGNIVLRSNVGGTITDNILIDGGSGNVAISGNINATGGNVATRNVIGNLVGTTATITGGFTGGNITVTGPIVGTSATLSSSISGSSLTTSGNVTAQNITSNANVVATTNVIATSSMVASGYFYSNGVNIIQNALPSGVITLWSGSIASIPTGWALCNGSNGTPDLRNLFIVGAGSTYAVGASGGSANAVVVSHTHTATSTVSDPGHFHSVQYNYGGAVNPGQPSSGETIDSMTDNTSTANTGISVSTSIATAGVSGTNANLPPYYALAYIMKL